MLPIFGDEEKSRSGNVQQENGIYKMVEDCSRGFQITQTGITRLKDKVHVAGGGIDLLFSYIYAKAKKFKGYFGISPKN